MDTTVTILCEKGHTILHHGGNSANAGHNCQICLIMRNCKGITYEGGEIKVGQTRFMFRCSEGHLASYTTGTKKCSTCYTVSVAEKKGYKIVLDSICYNSTPNAKLRAHCLSTCHDYLCTSKLCTIYRNTPSSTGYKHDPLCKNYITCGRDFYLTQRMVTNGNILSCVGNHYWGTASGRVITAIRIFELLYNDRFDYPAPVDLSGYNDTLGIAFTYETDKTPYTLVDVATKYCKAHNIRMYVIPHVDSAARIADSIINSVYPDSRIVIKGDTKRIIYDNLRMIMKSQNKRSVYLENRII
jgi:hypothetical protein